MTPISLHMINFGPYVDSKINFDFRSALIAGELSSIAEASNGTGKSTIFQAITWVLTGSSRYKNASRIIRHGTDSTKVVLLFEEGGVNYRIVRGRNRANKVTLDFTKLNADGTEENIKADTNSQLDEKIAQVTRVRYDSFLNTVYFAQNSISDFMYGTSSVRQKLVAEILAMDKWNDHAKKADLRSKEAEKDLDIVRYKITGLGDPQAQIQRISAELPKLSADADAARTVLQSAHAELASAKMSAAGTAALLHNERQRAALTREVESLIAQVSACQSDVATLTADLAALVRPQVVAPPGARPTKLDSILDKLAKLSGERQVAAQHLQAAIDGKCVSCGWSSGDDRQTHIDSRRATLAELDRRITVGQAARDAANTELREWEAAQAAAQRSDIDAARYESAVVMRQSRLDTANNRLLSLQATLSDKSAELSRLPAVAVGPVVDVAAAEAAAAAASARSSDVERRLLESQHKLAAAQAQLAELSKLDKVRETLEHDLKLYSSLARHFGKNGIQSHILDTVVAELESLSNKFLTRLNHKPFSVQFITQKLDTKGQPKETFDIEVVSPEGRQSIEDISGGEQFRVAFSIRLALATIQARRLGGELQMLMLDEVSSSLDKRGLETFVSIIRELEKTMKIMVITHDDSLKEHFDNVIKVKHNGTTAEVSQ